MNSSSEPAVDVGSAAADAREPTAFRLKVGIGFSLAILAVGSAGMVAYRTAARSDEAWQRVMHGYEVLGRVRGLRNFLTLVENSPGGNLMVTDEGQTDYKEAWPLTMTHLLSL